MLKESLSSRATPSSKSLKRTKIKNADIESQDNKSPAAESTDISKAGDLDLGSSGLCKPQKYDWTEVAHLFEGQVIPDELLNVTDPIEYNYIIVRLKKDFNEKNKSEYLKYMNLQLPYHSRRDEVGGQIS